MRPKTLSLVMCLVAMLLAAVPGAAQASRHVSTIVEFDPAAGELAEGVAVDKTGNVFVSLAPLDARTVGPRLQHSARALRADLR